MPTPLPVEQRRVQAIHIANQIMVLTVQNDPIRAIEIEQFFGEIEPFVAPQPAPTKHPSMYTTFDVRVTFGNLGVNKDLRIRISFVEELWFSDWNLAYVTWEDVMFDLPDERFPNGKPIPAFRGSTFIYLR